MSQVARSDATNFQPSFSWQAPGISATEGLDEAVPLPLKW